MTDLSCEVLEPFGARVDLDLREPFTREREAALRKVFADHRLLVFRNQQISRDQQERLVRLFGPISPPEQDVPIVTNLGDNAATLGDVELAFHVDMAYAPDPYTAISLYAEKVADDKTSTLFVDGVDLWEKMPIPLREKITATKIRNVYQFDYSQRDARRKLDPRLPQGIFPMVRTHSVSGKTYLYVSQTDTHEIVGLDPDESEALLGEVFAHCYRQENILRHKWRRGDLVLWDNLALQHGRDATGKAERTLRRVSTIPRTLSEQFPAFPRGWADIAEMFYTDDKFLSTGT